MLVFRFKTWLRNFVSHTPPRVMLSAPTTQEAAAAQLVERSRQGDQNATAMLTAIGVNAKKGVPRAISAKKAVLAYMASHPAKNPVSFGAELAAERETDLLVQELQADCFGVDYCEGVKRHVPNLALQSPTKAIVTLANGPNLLKDGERNLLDSVKQSFPEPEQKAFVFGMRSELSSLDQIPPDKQAAFLVGHTLATARKIQAVRLPGVPLKVLAPSLGVEFCEV
jgi:hypothetical protein